MIARPLFSEARPPAIAAGITLLLTILLLGLVGLMLGTIRFAPDRIALTLVGRGDATAALILLDWRLPRVAMALAVGGALGMAGAIFQTLVRNPLGSPDVMGFSAGAQTGGMGAAILFSAGPPTVALGAVAGGLATAALVHALAWNRGVDAMRLILVGVAMSAMLAAGNQWLLIRGSLDAAMGAATWSAGSLAGMSWVRALPAATGCGAGMALCLARTRVLRLIEMGDDVAAALGVDIRRERLVLTILGTALTAAATAATGPIAFVALAAPQLARRLGRTGGVAPLLAGLIGALMLLAADLVAQHGFAPVRLPAGLVTLCIGGAYLVWLLLRQRRIVPA